MDTLRTRAGDRCELCGDGAELEGVAVDGDGADDAARCVLLCGTCRPCVASSDALDSAHWYCLQESIWSEEPAVQVLSYRLLHRLAAQPWATELLDQVYLEDAVLAWADSGLGATGDGGVVTKDCHGAVLTDGDSVTLIKDLDVKGAGFTAKRGTLVKNIRVGDDPTHIEGRVNKVSIMLKTCFLKRVS